MTAEEFKSELLMQSIAIQIKSDELKTAQENYEKLIDDYIAAHNPWKEGEEVEVVIIEGGRVRTEHHFCSDKFYIDTSRNIQPHLKTGSGQWSGLYNTVKKEIQISKL